MKKRAIFKILFLLNIIYNKNATKKEIIEEFKKSNLEISPNLITLYIKKLINSGFNIEISKSETSTKENVYKLKKTFHYLDFSNEEIELLHEAGLLVISQKDWRYIETFYDLLHNISKYLKNTEQKNYLLNFGYFSNLNWRLIKILKEHCAKKSTLLLDYLLPDGGNIIIEYKLQSLELGDLSQRLYLTGRLKDAKGLFRLPVDRIYRIKKDVTKEHREDTKILQEKFRYSVLKENIEYIELKKGETIIEDNNDYITVETNDMDDFKTIQRLLYFCPDLCYISSERIKNLLCDSLKKMEKLYD